MRQVRAKIAEPLEIAGLPLYAQHIDAIDNANVYYVQQSYDRDGHSRVSGMPPLFACIACIVW